ncbi:TOBE domain-containing protein [Pelotomaculum terephthalicicum JT]|uniref:TOBE domain-containing protein n=1 Tax=Pelotomaculum TaxID=191373 RepID=UPI0009C59F14|nr:MULTISPECIES: TOBE domain-containing protein [Pelotomaculum]MCG9966611.1 TOBE domain-containing protein [Pelotomaculum terephthalicicum JT]OPX92297.1 MAG: Molybdenum-pterin-binding protein 2 [Pelotomaculum sp. PtaB.Bin117]OPY63550.1 MAG: Molybdenum-pterin-binding protein 2 [Pelotomaculum sp. PtaU1.Bin065]
MDLSARNQLTAHVKNVKSNDISAEVTLDVGGQEMCANITADSVKKLGIKAGDEITAVIKASSVMLMK